MSGPATATIETLTAEVRVLMVGNRQVTLSVYRQLDKISADAITAFGRIRDSSEKDLNRDQFNIVGADPNGVLVRATVTPPDWVRYCEDFNHWYAHRHSGQVNYGGCSQITDMRHGQHVLQYIYDRHDRCPQDLHLDQKQHPRPTPPRKYDNGPLDYGDPDYRAAAAVWDWLDAEKYHHVLTGRYCEMAALHASWSAQAAKDFADLTTRQDRYDNLKQLPLIVLAGLR